MSVWSAFLYMFYKFVLHIRRCGGVGSCAVRIECFILPTYQIFENLLYCCVSNFIYIIIYVANINIYNSFEL